MTDDTNNIGLQVKDRFDEVFTIEMDGWCYGVQNYPGEIFPGLIHAVIKELAPSFRAAIEHNYVFDVLELSLKFSKAAKYLIHEKEIAYSILAQLPHPQTLNEDAQYVLAQIIDQAEQAYGDILDRMKKKWALEVKKAA